MPTRWRPQRANRLYDRGGARSADEGRTLSTPRVQAIVPPWGGFTPDLSPELTDWRDSEVIANLLTRQDVLVAPDGYAKVNSATLPLGDASPPAAGADISPVVFVGQFTDSVGVKRQYAISSNAVQSRLYFNSSGAWVEIPIRAATTFITGKTTGAGVAQNLTDAAYHPPSNSIFLCDGYNYVFNHPVGSADFGFTAGMNLISARSVCAADGRVLLFHIGTPYGASTAQNRVQYTTIGGTPLLTGLGSGFIDLDEMEGPGLRIRKLGNVIACYGDRTVAFLRRRTSASTPYTREYLDERRGLLGTFSSCGIAESAHFGIYNDGWYIVREDGVFQEVGRRIVGGRSYRKFTDMFYRILNTARQERVYVECDIARRLVTIVFPTTDSDHPSARWLYDLDTDTVWPTEELEVPNCLGRMEDTAQVVGWDDISTTWAATTGGWADFDQQNGRLRVCAGTRSGLVWRYSPAITTYDGVLPTWRMRSFPNSLGFASGRKTWEKLYVGYERIEGTPTPISVELHNHDGVISSDVFTPDLGIAGTRQLDYVNPGESGASPGGHRLGYELSGTHPAKLVMLEANYRLEGIQERRIP